MDPEFVTASAWVDIAWLLKQLAVFSFSIITGALAFLLGHGVIPTLVYTRHLPEQMYVMRPLFYSITAVALVGALFFLTRVIGLMGTVYAIYFKLWV